MIRTKTKFKKADFFYYLFIILLIFLYMLESSAIPNFNNSVFHDIIQSISLLSIILCIIFRKYEFRELIIIFFLNSIGIICFFSSGNTGLFMTILAVTLLPNNSLNKVLFLIFKEEVFLFIIIVVLSQLGVIPDIKLEIFKGTYTATGRALGFEHPNMLAAQTVSIILLFICVKREYLKKRHLFLSLILCLVVFGISQSRTALLLSLLTIILLTFRKKKLLQKIIYRIIPVAYIITIVSIIICIAIFVRLGNSNVVARYINDGLFNGRIGLAYTSLITYPTTLFGKHIDTSIWNQWQYFALDNGQVMIWLEYGIIGFFVYFIIIQKALNQIKKEKNIVLAIIIITFILWSMYEGTMYFIGKNFTLLFLGTCTMEDLCEFGKGKSNDT